MNRRRIVGSGFVFCWSVWIGLAAAVTVAQDAGQRGTPSIFARHPVAASPVEVENQREFLRSTLTQRLDDAREVRQLEQRLNRMSGAQLQALTSAYRRQTAAGRQQLMSAAQRQLAVAQAARDRLVRERQRLLANRNRGVGVQPRVARFPGAGFVPVRGVVVPYGYYAPGRVVGYVPNVTWFPTGASLTAAGTVSPDGRHVRVTAQPFFSSVPAVHTFNPYTGVYRRIR